MRASVRLFKYIIPYSGSIAIAIICALLIAACEAGYAGILAETIDVIKLIDTKGLPVSVTFLNNFTFLQNRIPLNLNMEEMDKATPPERSSGKLEIYLEDRKAALRLISLISLAILSLFIIKGILSFGKTYMISRIGQKLILNLRGDLYDRMVYFPLGFFTERRTGDIMSRGTSDMAILQNSFNSIAGVFQAAATVLIFVFIMLIMSWQLTLLTAVIFPPAIYVINRIGKRIKRASSRIQEKVADISSYLERTIFGIKIIKSFATEDWERTRFADENKAKYSAAMRRVRLSAYLIPLIELMTAVGMVAVFWLGFWQVTTGQLTTGWFMGFIAMVGMIYRPVKTLGSFNAAFQQGLASAERIFDVVDIEPEAHDAPDAVDINRINGEVEFRDVTFSYNGERPILNHINLQVEAGQTIALVGPSGAGKTTMVNLLTRFYEIKNGEITIDGHPISRISLRSLRKQVGLVPQETVIFGGTVWENIAYGRFDATDEEVIEAAKNANAHEFIVKMPKGYNTPIGERGMQISGGQRQRLAIARAILKDPRILILDEATSSLDTESEALIQEALSNLMKDRTTFVIAHRLSTVVKADMILVLNNGEIVESGTHKELIAHNGLYRKLCQAQFQAVE
jgi:subfamily B ATP-binding cassette protein MsbA